MNSRLRRAAIALASMVTLALVPGLASGVGQAAGLRAGSGPVLSAESSVPWSDVGPGWLLATWSPSFRALHPPLYVELVSPQSVTYVLFRVPGNAYVIGWSAHEERVLYVQGNHHLVVASLESGATLGAFNLPTSASFGGFGSGASFTEPDGLEIYASGFKDGVLRRYSLDGTLEAHFPAAVPGLGRVNASWLESPDGTQVWLGTARGLAVFSNDGALLGSLPVTKAEDCIPERWWSSSIVLAQCTVVRGAYNYYNRLYEFSAAWSRGRPLMSLPKSLYLPGYSDGYRVGGKIILQQVSYCGLPRIAELQGSKVVVPVIPWVGGSEGEAIVAATSTTLALETQIGGCGPGHLAVGWWDPDADTVAQVLGPPYQGGGLFGVIGYPDPLGTGN